jgi:hypothetical protein
MATANGIDWFKGAIAASARGWLLFRHIFADSRPRGSSKARAVRSPGRPGCGRTGTPSGIGARAKQSKSR